MPELPTGLPDGVGPLGRRLALMRGAGSAIFVPVDRLPIDLLDLEIVVRIAHFLSGRSIADLQIEDDLNRFLRRAVRVSEWSALIFL
jgi:hypothetical protein